MAKLDYDRWLLKYLDSRERLRRELVRKDKELNVLPHSWNQRKILRSGAGVRATRSSNPAARLPGNLTTEAHDLLLLLVKLSNVGQSLAQLRTKEKQKHPQTSFPSKSRYQGKKAILHTQDKRPFDSESLPEVRESYFHLRTQIKELLKAMHENTEESYFQDVVEEVSRALVKKRSYKWAKSYWIDAIKQYVDD